MTTNNPIQPFKRVDKNYTHKLTIELTPEEMEFLTDKASKRGYLPVAFLKYMALSPETITITAKDLK